ncbi:MAG: hypothetical protein M3277_12495 [Actinomycetota bacterium]|nr:hypothetical protein [Actinomycetota bacterium]
MSDDLRSELNRLAPTPTRRLDPAALVAEGRRRRRGRYIVYAAAAVVAGVVVTTGSRAIDLANRENESIPAAPATTPPAADFAPGWTQLPSSPEVRTGPAAAWTGTQLLVWGGYVYTGYSDEAPAANGFFWDATTEAWASLPESPLHPRSFPAAAWTGRELIVWGGWDGVEAFFDDGAAFDPETGEWRSLPESPLTPRAPLSVWTGSELLVWGTDVRVDDPHRDGAAYDPESDTWRTIAPAPIALTDATAVWSGSEMIVFGARLGRNNDAATETAIGAAYDPATDSWRQLTDSTLSPQASTAAWDGREMIAWDYLNESAAYDPARDRWRSLPQVPLDSMECVPEALSLGESVFGHYCGESVEFDRSRDGWRVVSHREILGTGATLVSGDRSVFLMVRGVETKKEATFVYRPGG